MVSVLVNVLLTQFTQTQQQLVINAQLIAQNAAWLLLTVLGAIILQSPLLCFTMPQQIWENVLHGPAQTAFSVIQVVSAKSVTKVVFCALNRTIAPNVL